MEQFPYFPSSWPDRLHLPREKADDAPPATRELALKHPGLGLPQREREEGGPAVPTPGHGASAPEPGMTGGGLASAIASGPGDPSGGGAAWRRGDIDRREAILARTRPARNGA
jgi:hypothetical protein